MNKGMYANANTSPCASGGGTVHGGGARPAVIASSSAAHHSALAAIHAAPAQKPSRCGADSRCAALQATLAYAAKPSARPRKPASCRIAMVATSATTASEAMNATALPARVRARLMASEPSTM